MDVAAKLQVRPGQSVAVVGLPDGVDLGLSTGDAGAATAAPAPDEADVVMVFTTDSAMLRERADVAVAAALRDALCWVAYPKAGQLGTDLNRDRLAAALSDHGIRPVRQVSVDGVWSALRFRPA
jgi:hypothetical protein